MKWMRAACVMLLPLVLAGCFAGVSSYPTSEGGSGAASSPPAGVAVGTIVAPGLYVQSGDAVEAVGLLVKRADGTWAVLKTTDAAQAASAALVATVEFDAGMKSRVVAAKDAYVSATGTWTTGASATTVLRLTSVKILRDARAK